MKKLFYFLSFVTLSLLLASCGDGYEPEPVNYDANGALKGLFSINENGDKIQFSRGNLQFQPSTETLRFATHQWDFVGDETKGTVIENGVISNNNICGEDNYKGWMDLFGWGTGNDPGKTSTSVNDYIDKDKYTNTTFIDWGINTISNGGNKAGMWRTLSQEEWTYLFEGRNKANQLYGLAMVNSINGIIILPNDWKLPDYVFFTPGVEGYSNNVYTAEQWGILEAAGAVFLPAAGRRYNFGNVIKINEQGCYWTSTRGFTVDGIVVYVDDIWFSQSALYTQPDNTYPNQGFSVRLVKDVK